MKVKVEMVNIGKFDYDAIVVTINKVKTEICFKKSSGIEKYEGKMIELVEKNGMYSIKETKSSESETE